jgi:hypothetical protein
MYTVLRGPQAVCMDGLRVGGKGASPPRALADCKGGFGAEARPA